LDTTTELLRAETRDIDFSATVGAAAAPQRHSTLRPYDQVSLLDRTEVVILCSSRTY
jgi:hypothetical protein